MSCKGETKSDVKMKSGIDASVYEMWDNFTKANPEFDKNQLPEAWHFHNNKEDANRLAKLIVSGEKRASSNLYFWYAEANADFQKIGSKHIITDFDGKAKAIIEIKKIDTIPFHKITSEYAALDMGTKIEPLTKWKKAHWDFFEKALKESGEKPTENMLIVCEWFDTIWTEKDN